MANNKLVKEKNSESGPDYELIDPQRVFSLLPLRPYQTVADVWCGAGAFSISLGKYLFDGKVYAIDISQVMLKSLKKRLGEIRLGNVETVFSKTNNKIPIKKDILDGILIAFSLGKVDDQGEFLKDLLGHLRVGGWAAVIDWHKKKMDIGPSLNQRFDISEVQSLAEKAGYAFVKSHNLDEHHYLVLLRKTGKKTGK